MRNRLGDVFEHVTAATYRSVALVGPAGSETARVKYPFDRVRTRQFTTITVLGQLRQRLVARG